MKKLLELIKLWWGKTTATTKTEPVTNQTKPTMTKERSTKKTGTASNEMLEQLRTFIFSRYELRYNLVSEQTEYRRKNKKNEGHAFTKNSASNDRKWQCIDQRVQNTISLEALTEGINCWDRDVNRLLHSEYIDTYHPIKDYIDHLPVWDGDDRVTALASRISTDELWLRGFHTWMRAMVAQWMNLKMQSANALAPILVSEEQGLQKSTFCRMLLPPELKDYYIDRFDVNSTSRFEQRLATCALINMDEFDRYSQKAMASLKNVMQMQTSNFRKVGTSQYVNLYRTASFIGTSNSQELLSDPSGSRRFMCMNIDKTIDCSPIDHEQIYAQLREELIVQGLPPFLSKNDERQWQEHNRLFSITAAEEEAFTQVYRPALPNEDCRLLTCSEIITSLAKLFPRLMKDIRPRQMTRTLQSLGVVKVHTRTGNVYRVVPVCTE